MKPTPAGWPRLSSSVFYDDAATAIDWLCRAFGFEVRMKMPGPDGKTGHAEVTFKDAVIMIGPEQSNGCPTKAPATIKMSLPSTNPAIEAANPVKELSSLTCFGS